MNGKQFCVGDIIYSRYSNQRIKLVVHDSKIDEWTLFYFSSGKTFKATGENIERRFLDGIYSYFPPMPEPEKKEVITPKEIIFSDFRCNICHEPPEVCAGHAEKHPIINRDLPIIRPTNYIGFDALRIQPWRRRG
jgi:hypothetical protein